MKPKGKARERIFTVFFMFTTTLIVISIVSMAHLLTAEIVQRNANLYLKKAILSCAGIEVPEDTAAVESLYEKRVKPIQDNPDCYSILDERNKEVQWYAAIESGPGLWGEITAVIGFYNDGETLKSTEFIKHNETPGLGARITEEWFKQQFDGKRPPLIIAHKGAAAGTNEFDAVTGASITSAAVRDILNHAKTNINKASIVKEK